jgi:hypothetical protein
MPLRTILFSINRTPSPTVLTSFAKVVPTTVLFGGNTIRNVVFIRSIGIVAGTYAMAHADGTAAVDRTLCVERGAHQAESVSTHARRRPRHS